MRIGMFASGLAALAVAVCPAVAQDRRSDDVVVTGKRAPPIETTRAIIRAIAPRVGSNEQIPRLYDPACISVGGLKQEIAQAVADRMVANAGEAGLAIGRSGCKANVLVMIATDGRAEAQDVARRQAYFFGGHSVPAISQFTDGPGPDRIFSAIELASADGDRANGSGMQTTAEGATLAGVDAPTLKQAIATRIGPSVRRVIGATVLVIDRAALVGKTPTQIADYATMRVLTGARYNRDAGEETILSLLQPGVNAPSELTKIDRSLLVAMYRNRDLRNAMTEINAATRIAIRN